MALSAELAIALCVSVVGHTGALLVAGLVPPASHTAPSQPVEVTLLVASPLVVDAGCARCATEATGAASQREVVERPRRSPPRHEQAQAQAQAQQVLGGEDVVQARAMADEMLGADEPHHAAAPSEVVAAPRDAEGSALAARDASGPSTTASPRYRSNPAPVYPLMSRRHREQGTVILRVTVSRDGHALDVTLETSCGYPALDAAAQAAVRTWSFTPAQQAGTAVQSSVLIPVRFALDR